MSSSILQHPEEADLMRLLDGELAEREARAIRRHTDSCWQCRRDLNEMQTAIDAYLRLRDAVVYPPPPRAWAALHPPVPEERRVWQVWRLALAAGVVFAGVYYLRPPAPAPVKKAPAAAPVPAPAATPAAVGKRVVERAPEAVKVSPVSMEVEVLAALHRVGADLGEAVEVIVEKDGILVRATALDSARAAVVRAAVAGARFELVEPKAVMADGVPGTAVVPRPVVFGVGDDLANAVIDESDATTARAFAIARMTARFQGVTLAEREARMVRDIEEDHRLALRQHVGRLRKLLSEFRAPEEKAGGERSMAELARELDELVSAGFAGARSSLSDAEIVGRLHGVLRELAR
ncbi:MAG: anti-sigma factor family protein [Bryobacteraceae bacterium]